MAKKDIWQTVKGVISSVAPVVGTAIGGPFGGIAANIVRSALGVDSDEAAVQALSSDPDALLKLKTAEMDFKKFMREADLKEDQLELEEYKVTIDDRKDSRDMAKVLKTVWPQMTIVIALTVMIGFVLHTLFNSAPPAESKDVLYMLLGQLIAGWSASIAFFVGTTKSSAEKSGQIAALKAGAG